MTSAARGVRCGERGILDVLVAPAVPTAAVLFLHGGRSEGPEPPPLVNLPALRMRPFAADLRRALAERDVLVAMVRYRRRGWNGVRADPARDAEAALAVVLRTAGDIPVALVGHSMGARAALRAAGHPAVRGVVGLAPWCPPEEPVEHLVGRWIHLLHDEADRVTSARETWEFVRRAAAVGAHAEGIAMRRGGHAMLRGAADWQRRTTELVVALLATPQPGGGTGEGRPV
ncbi:MULTISPECIES: alpha/beta fold hydrolase [Streptomyces]|uniref:Alpha/beta hydrolase n=1 Tax=Streptomyces venezuelae TaxID=54571 RepID=A0A5P2B1N3_STRVZ|nr:alpha/beta fold hydrolase [Streptomyces venezuelae]QES24216.1 alpha/beta hydrolase [Streptomyces venezuelae]